MMINRGTNQISEKILLVDDDAFIRTIGKVMLEHLGYNIDSACDGKEALDLLKTKKYEILITDVCMPIMNGLQLVEKIHGTHPDLKIIIISGNIDDNTFEDFARFRIFNFLEKPFTSMQLEKVLQVKTLPELENSINL